MANHTPLEDAEQETVVEYLDWMMNIHPAIHPLFFSTLNGAALLNGGATMNKLKLQGFVPGVHDMLYLEPRGGYFCLTLEMKRQKGGVKSDNQLEFQRSAREQGAYSHFAKGAGEAIEIIDEYLAMPRTQDLLLDAQIALENGDKDTALNILRDVTEKW